MSGELNPLENPLSWDKILVGGVNNPGLAIVGEVEREYEWDVKKGKGTVGATTTFVGKPPAAFSVTVVLWTIDHFYEWDTFKKLLLFDPLKKTPTAVDIFHPSLQDLSVTSVVTTDVGAIKNAGGNRFEVNVSFLEYFPAPKKSAVGTPNGSKSTPKGTTPGTPADPIADAQQAEIKRLMAEAAKP